MAPKHTTGGPRAHYPGINKVAPAHAIGGSHRSEYSIDGHELVFPPDVPPSCCRADQ